MNTDDPLPTRSSLLNAVRDPGNHARWDEFHQTYRGLLTGVARRSGLNEHEAEEALQDTLLAVAQKMPDFQYDPAKDSFKGWLLQIVRWKIADQFRKRAGHAKRHAPSDDDVTQVTTGGFDFPKAEPLFRKAFELDRAEWALRSNFARYLTYMGRFTEAEEIMNQIRQEQPDKAGTYGVTLGWLYAATGRLPQAIAALDAAIQLEAARPNVYLLRGEIRLSMNERAVGLQDLLRTVELDGFASLDPATDGAALRKIFTDKGPEEFLRRLIQLLEDRKNAGRWVYSFDLARLHAHAGNKVRALDHLERAVEERGGMLLSSKVIPAFKSLREEPRFHAVLRRLKLQD